MRGAASFENPKIRYPVLLFTNAYIRLVVWGARMVVVGNFWEYEFVGRTCSAKGGGHMRQSVASLSTRS